jgi:DNA-directed RNA polymerase specialized sigma24 family protein
VSASCAGLPAPARDAPDVHGGSHREIASRYGLAEGTTRAQLFAARLRPRARLAHHPRPSA